MGIIKSAKNIAIDEAKRTAKDISSEFLEIPKSAPKQAIGQEDKEKTKKETSSGLPKLPSLSGFDVGEDAKKISQDVSEQIVGKKTEEETEKTKQEIKTSPIVEAMIQTSSGSKDKEAPKIVKGSDDVEREMQKLRELRKKQEKEWNEQQEAIMKQPQAPTKLGEPIIPPSSPKKGPQGPGGPKKAQIETRKSKH